MSPWTWVLIGLSILLLALIALYEFSGYQIYVLLVEGNCEFAVLDYDPEKPTKQRRA